MQKIKSGIGRSLSSAVPVLQATYAQFVERHFSHPLIQGGFLFHPIFFGQNPYTSPDKIAMIHAIERQWGVAYLQGGMRNLVRLLVDYFQRLSGKLYLGTAVDQIEVAKDRVTGIRLQDGEFRQADYIISNLSPYQTQARLIRTGTKPIQAGPKFGCSFMVMYLVVRDIPHREKLNLHTIIHPDGFSNNMQSVFHTDRFASSPWIYIYFPGVIESQATDDGTETMVVITPLPNLSLIEHTSKEMLTIRRKVLSALNTLLPGFEQTIVHEKITSPRLLQETNDMDWGTHYQPIRPLLIDRLFFSGDSVWRGLGLVSALASAEEISRQISNE
jgi:phytoene desaturase